MERAALDHAAKGRYVFPVRPGGKRPATAHGFKDATRDERRILHAWDPIPDANIGVACGASKIVVLDIDSRSGAHPDEILGELDLHGAPVVSTGEAPEPSEKYPKSLAGVRGAQVHFRGEIPSTNLLAIEGCEIKGVGGYVVVPPSVHPSGVEYVGELPPVWELPAVPGWLLELVKASPTRARRSALPPRETLDPLFAIGAEIYVPALSGCEPGPDWKIHCPFHDDAEPSLHIYDAGRGWFCFGCRRGGTIIDFASHLWGLEPRGEGFFEIRQRVAEELLPVIQEMAR
jgi:hypothetical protein